MGLDTFPLVVRMLVREASYQAKLHHIKLMAYLDLDTYPLVVHKMVREASFQVKQKVKVEAYCFDTIQAIQSFRIDSY